MDDKDERALIREIESLRHRVVELEHCEVERKRTEATFLDLFNATEEAAFLMNQEGIILVANKNAARLYGIPMERLTGASVYDLIPPGACYIRVAMVQDSETTAEALHRMVEVLNESRGQ